MPTYQYACTECGDPLEVVQSFTDDALTECPSCGGRLKKLYGAVGIVFKGSGFYRNDSRGSQSGAASSTNGATGSGGSTGSGDKAAAGGPATEGSGASGGSSSSGGSGGTGGSSTTTGGSSGGSSAA